MSKEYIERWALLEKRHKVCEHDEAGFCITYQAVPVEDIQQAPAADVVEVKHGRWGEYEVHPLAPSLNGYPCSVCDNRQKDLRGLNYCPNCGAKMDGE